MSPQSNHQSYGKCGVCDNEAKSRCAGCFQMFYCSREHQKQDWNVHKTTCSPIKVKTCEKFGRYYVATRDIKPGEIVLRESPLVFGPSQATPPVCVGCLQVKKDINKRKNVCMTIIHNLYMQNSH
jgi:hypothetical protein